MNALVQFQAPRLPYHPVVEERFGVDKTSWKALVEAVFPSAQSVDAVVMALAYCKRRNLDVFKKPVHIVPVWDSKRREMVETVWPGIAEMRTTAMRTGQYAGKDKTVFGPNVVTKLGGVEMTFPEWAQITLYRVVPGVGKCAFEGPEVCWTETYATAKRDTDAPNTMWRKRPRGQLEKCAEAAALRCAFPEELGNEYAAEEMEGRSIGADGAPITVTEKAQPRKLHADFEEASVPDTPHDAETGEIIDAVVEEVAPKPAKASASLKTGAQLLAEKQAAGAAEQASGSDAPDETENAAQDADFEPAGPSDGFPGDRAKNSEVEQGGGVANNGPADAQDPEYLFEDAAEFASAAPAYIEQAASPADLKALWGQWAPDRLRLKRADPAAYRTLCKLADQRAAELEAEADRG